MDRARISRFGPLERVPAAGVEPLSLSESSKIIPTLDVLRLIVFPSAPMLESTSPFAELEPLSRRLGDAYSPIGVTCRPLQPVSAPRPLDLKCIQLCQHIESAINLIEDMYQFK